MARARPRQSDTAGVTRICCILGPNRNLTTLTASLAMLHPNCQVLNHAGQRVLNTPIDFLLSHDKTTLDEFVQFALEASTKGQRGPYGGSITFSHGFDDCYLTKAVYRERYGKHTDKEQVICLLWKEALLVSQHLRAHRVDLCQLLEANHALRFLMPVRNPLDCAMSNIATGHTYWFKDQLPKGAKFRDVLRAVLCEIRWGMDICLEFPDRTMMFYEDELRSEIDEFAVKLSDFLGLPRDARWFADVRRACVLNPSHRTSREKLDLCRALIEKEFVDLPDHGRKLIEKVEQSGAPATQLEQEEYQHGRPGVSDYPDTD